MFALSAEGLLQANNAIIHGTIFANAGQIGNMTIGDINNKIVGKNLILNSANLSYDGITGNDPTTDNNDIWGVEYGYINVGSSYMNLSEGEDVVISFDLEMNVYRTSFNPILDKDGNPTGKFNNNEPYLQIYNTNNEGPITFDSQTLYFYDVEAGDIIKGRYYIKTKIRHRIDATLPDNYIEFFSNYYSNNYFRIKNLKLEKGTVATDWCPADEDGMSANVSANYSWLFSPTDGIKMWNTTQGNEEIFRVDNNGLYIKGEISADTGSIGAWNIGSIGTGWGNNEEYPDSLYSKTKINNTDYLAFLRIPTTASDHVFSIRTKNSSGTISNPFYITKDGSINASRGKISSFTFDSSEMNVSSQTTNEKNEVVDLELVLSANKISAFSDTSQNWGYWTKETGFNAEGLYCYYQKGVVAGSGESIDYKIPLIRLKYNNSITRTLWVNVNSKTMWIE